MVDQEPGESKSKHMRRFLYFESLFENPSCEMLPTSIGAYLNKPLYRTN